MSEESKLTQHFLVPEHVRLAEEQKQEFLKKNNISIKQLPMIHITDPAIKDLGFKVQDVLLIKRKSAVTKEADYYRVVVDG